MSEWKDRLQENEPAREAHPAGEQAVAQKTAEETPRRRRRADRYQEEQGQDSRERVAVQPNIQARSETAQEVANRYRQRENGMPRPEDAQMGGTTRVPVQKTRLAGAQRQSAENGGSERVGYPSGRMGMTPPQRARMSEAGRARLAQESQEAEMPSGGRKSNAGYAMDARYQNRPGSARGMGDPYAEDRRYSGRPIVPERRQEEPPRRTRKGLTAAIILLLAVGLCLVAVLAMPEDGPLGGIRKQLSGLLNREEAASPEVLSFTLQGQDSEETPANVIFEAVTGRNVADVRLLREDGDPLAQDLVVTEQADSIRWEIGWYAEEPYEGEVRLQILKENAWTDTEGRALVRVTAPVREAQEAIPEETEIPVVFTTEEPTATPTPTATPVPTAAKTEEPGAQEDPMEDEEPAAILPVDAADPDDPGAEWNTDEETEDGTDPADAGEAAEDEGTSLSAEGQEASEDVTAAAEALPEEETTERKLMTVSAAESADPSLITATVVYNGTKKVTEYARSDKEKIHMPTLGEYTKQKMGVLTFRSDAFRQNAAIGTVKGMDSLSVAWTADAGSIKGSGQTYYGIGWVGQPAIVKWSKQVREQSEMYDAKKEKSGLKEVIVAGQDGRIYFLDLSDGSATRNSIKLGYPMKGAPSVHPGGAPYFTVGQFARKMASGTGYIGLRQYNLYLLKELSLIDGLDAKNNRPYNKIGSFETSALIDRTTGCMVTAGTNGLLYLINLNSEFDYNAGTYTQSPTQVVMKSKAKGEKDASTAVEASVAMYDRYVYYADMGGILRCVDTNTLTTAWAVSLGDSVESTPALDWHGEDGLDLYVATELSLRKGREAEVICFDALSGEERWTAAFGVKKDTKNKTVSGFRASPVVGQNSLGDYVYYTVNNLSDEGQEQLGIGSETAAIVALRKEDGSIAWAHGLNGRGYSSPVAVYDEEGNGAIIQCAGDGSILMLDGETGEERATLQLDGAIEASPAVYDGMMVIGTTEKNKNNIYGIRIE